MYVGALRSGYSIIWFHLKSSPTSCWNILVRLPVAKEMVDCSGLSTHQSQRERINLLGRTGTRPQCPFGVYCMTNRSIQHTHELERILFLSWRPCPRGRLRHWNYWRGPFVQRESSGWSPGGGSSRCWSHWPPWSNCDWNQECLLSYMIVLPFLCDGLLVVFEKVHVCIELLIVLDSCFCSTNDFSFGFHTFWMNSQRACISSPSSPSRPRSGFPPGLGSVLSFWSGIIQIVPSIAG